MIAPELASWAVAAPTQPCQTARIALIVPSQDMPTTMAKLEFIEGNFVRDRLGTMAALRVIQIDGPSFRAPSAINKMPPTYLAKGGYRARNSGTSGDALNLGVSSWIKAATPPKQKQSYLILTRLTTTSHTKGKCPRLPLSFQALASYSM